MKALESHGRRTFAIFHLSQAEPQFLQTLPVILKPAHPASFAHKFLFQRVPASHGMQ